MGYTMLTFIRNLLALQLILALCTMFVNGYVVKRFADLPELNGFPRLRLLNSLDELSPLPLVISEPPNEVTAVRSQNRRSVPTDDELKMLLARHRNSNSENSGIMPKSYAKKSQQTGYKALKKFNTSSSRNCFFSPVQCLVQFDLNKYRKLVDTSNMRFGSTATTLDE
ncbi:hypothetical protein M3Y97_00567800 [Aphelenchoides bicaudatus]|nr:hypothetical protein M3Y97_00567800 [Aphelenchoides bicaudatus]